MKTVFLLFSQIFVLFIVLFLLPCWHLPLWCCIEVPTHIFKLFWSQEESVYHLIFIYIIINYSFCCWFLGTPCHAEIMCFIFSLLKYFNIIYVPFCQVHFWQIMRWSDVALVVFSFIIMRFPVLSHIKLQAPFLVIPFLFVSVLQGYFPNSKILVSQKLPRGSWKPCFCIASCQRLWLVLLLYLIIFETLFYSWLFKTLLAKALLWCILCQSEKSISSGSI